jgi:hypothetical protein
MATVEVPPVALADEIDELILELGLQYVDEITTPDGRLMLKFRIRDRALTQQRDAEALAKSVYELLLTAPNERIAEKAKSVMGVIVE